MKRITNAEGLKIIDTRKPLGMFYVAEKDGRFTAIDNSKGEAWTEDFKTLWGVKQFLKEQVCAGVVREEEDAREAIAKGKKVAVIRVEGGVAEVQYATRGVNVFIIDHDNLGG